MNADIERFNGTIQREFANLYLDLFSVAMEAFQEKFYELAKSLKEWANLEHFLDSRYI